MHFKLIKDVDRAALEERAAWGQYYEPDDINTLAECGYNREEVYEAIKAVNWSDDYWFPIPNSADAGLFQFEHRRASFKTPSGRAIDGYVCNEGHAIGLFGSSEHWVINQSLMEMFDDERAQILEDLGLESDENLLPLHYDVCALGGAKVFPNTEG